MTFKGEELSAMVRLALAMAQADGHVAEDEKVAIALDLVKFGVSGDASKTILAGVAVIDGTDAMKIVANMSYEQKKYVVAYLAVVMAADGEIADAEVKMWSLISALCNLPTMTIAEAVNFWKNN